MKLTFYHQEFKKIKKMKFQEKLTERMKNAMKAKNQMELETLRAIKAEILLFQTNGNGEELTEETGIKIVQKLIKQRKDSLEIFVKEGRNDLAEIENKQIHILLEFLPKQLSEDELKEYLKELVTKSNIENIKDLGKAIGIASKELAGKAENKIISQMLKKILEDK